MPTALTRALREASAIIVPTTAADPPMSHFMSSMPSAGLIEMPPVSKVTPLPTNATGALSSPAPFHCMTTSFDSFAEPWPTPSNDHMPRSDISLTPRTSTFRPVASSPLTRSA